MTVYLTGYSGKTRTAAELAAWSEWQALDPEMQRRVKALMDDAAVAGRPVGIGSIFRSYQQQESLFYSRHTAVSVGGCCSFAGKRWALNKGAAHAAPPGRSYHEGTTPAGKALALDMIGDLKWMAANCAKYGLIEFSLVNKEPWHIQPAELPKARSQYVASQHAPLPAFKLPGTPPPPAPVKVWAPQATVKQRIGLLAGKNDPAQARAVQTQCNFWGWRDAMGNQLLVDGDFGAKSAQAVMSMQRTLGLAADGVYGPQTQLAFQIFLDRMSAISATK